MCVVTKRQILSLSDHLCIFSQAHSVEGVQPVHILTLRTGVCNEGENNTITSAQLSSDLRHWAARGFMVTLMVEILNK